MLERKRERTSLKDLNDEAHCWIYAKYIPTSWAIYYARDTSWLVLWSI